MDDHGSGTSTRTDVAIAPQAWSETPIGLIKKDSTKFCRGQYFWHTRAAIGHATALAVARRARVAEHTLRRNRAGLHPQDDLLHPYTPPVDI